MSEPLHIRLKGKELEYFNSRMAEWHLNKTEAAHRLISDHERLAEENKKQAHDLEVLKDLIANRPVASEADKRHQDQGKHSDIMKGCLRKFIVADYETKNYLCWNCRKNHRKEFDACEQLKSNVSI